MPCLYRAYSGFTFMPNTSQSAFIVAIAMEP